MNKIIIQNNTVLNDEDALKAVVKIVLSGRCSGTKGKEQYCYSTWIRQGNDNYMVSCFLNKKSDRFVINYK